MTGLLVAPLGPPERLFGVEDLAADGDRVVGAMRTAGWMRAEDGRPAVGVLGVLTDVVIGHATLFARPEGHWAVTTALSLEVARPTPCDGSAMTVAGELVSVDAGSALASGAVHDAAGRPVAVASVWTRFTPGLPDFAAVSTTGIPAPAAADSLLTVLGCVTDRRPDGRWRLTLPLSPLVLNAAGVVHGGVVVAAAETLAATATADPASPLTTAGLRASFLRPVVADGPVELLASVEHRGRTTSLTTVDVYGSDGRRAVVVSLAGRAV